VVFPLYPSIALYNIKRLISASKIDLFFLICNFFIMQSTRASIQYKCDTAQHQAEDFQ